MRGVELGTTGKNTMHTTVRLHKRKDELIETLHVVKHCGVVEFTKVTTVKLITGDPTVLGDYRTYQLGWYLVNLIVHGNPKGLS